MCMDASIHGRRAHGIGIGDAEALARICDFQRLHHLARRGRGFMIIARQMQHAMHHQMGGMVGETFCRPALASAAVTP